MTDVSLTEILLSRENRVRLQAQISEQYRCPLISFTMNIAGPVKNSPLIRRAFEIGLASLDALIPSEKIEFRHVDSTHKTGPLAIYAVKDEPTGLKALCVSIEEKTALGRLFDMDVLDEDLNKQSRNKERGCIVCGAPGRACAAGRLHSVQKLQQTANRIMTEEVFVYDRSRISNLAVESLIREVKTTPKPGLVDLNNNGSHTDMCVQTFERSANALLDYFSQSIEMGRKFADQAYCSLFSALRRAGIAAEARMYEATAGVNTHKGAIFSFGILCGAIGRLWSPEQPVPEESLLFVEASKIAEPSLLHDFANACGTTAGERMYLELGRAGIRAEAALGFPSVYKISLPVYRTLISDGVSPNEAGAITLLHLIASVDDSSIYKRGGADGLCFAKTLASRILKEKKIPSMKRIKDMDAQFIQRNLSAGGSADLLAITYFVCELEDTLNP